MVADPGARHSQGGKMNPLISQDIAVQRINDMRRRADETRRARLARRAARRIRHAARSDRG
jgi:hypothetical protein